MAATQITAIVREDDDEEYNDAGSESSTLSVADTQYALAAASGQLKSTLRKEADNLHRETLQWRLDTRPAFAQQQLLRYQRSAVRSDSSWCRLSPLAPSKDGGYIQVSVDGFNKFFTLGELVACAGGFSRSFWRPGAASGLDEESKMKGLDASHLCHQPSCTVVGHVIFEPSCLNQRRKGCPVWVPCPHVSCGKVVFCCNHDPPCIKFCAGFSDMSDLLARGAHH
ncbi:hypothetical protein IWX91DRAFT_318117 [Phyllosticta citricarpa]